MLERTLSLTIKKASRTFPSIVITGPRQSGKTTLLKKLFSTTHSYYNLESPDLRLRINEDPIGFLSQIKRPVILDEIQYAPFLLQYIKTFIDKNRKPNQWLLTGSQNFMLMQNVSESLAGRAAILTLMPLTEIEKIGNGQKSLTSSQMFSLNKLSIKKLTTDLLTNLLLGSYPEIVVNKKVDRQIWCGSYINTYLERDIRNLKQVGDLGEFERFLRACAVRTGQLLDLSGMAGELGISVSTAKRWLSLLQTGYQIYLLYPYYKNIGKRLIKRPKLYFTDTALASYLLGLHDKQTLYNSPHFPALFETFIVIDFLKRFYNFGSLPSLYYLRTRDNLEVDLILELEGLLYLLEIKSSSTIKPKHASSLNRAVNDLGKLVKKACLISNSPTSFPISAKVFNYSWKDLLLT
ncbi:GTP-binding protein [Candidatus Roizmanbacteria bacterium CG_4_9_14_0_8_um_filter_34_12]|uniref:GTP-binding protein n=1 Tax=Candidatus Roizmanbacteria bacterium CG_4_9_14_0_8_um_filter_34_12 TaxID=1974840 RepID=A0A2M8DC82_9BACT|nr:MAG: GTP-binding protein [Candidatus Roizmanbacteria bacterium CG_4_9_14_0_8_um_filter_34_12]